MYLFKRSRFLLFFSFAFLFVVFAFAQALLKIDMHDHAVNAWLDDEFKDVTNFEYKSLQVLDPSNPQLGGMRPGIAANDAKFQTMQAQTIRSVQQVVNSKAANDANYSGLTSPTPIQSAINSFSVTLKPSINWQALMVDLGVVSVGLANIFSGTNGISVNVRPVNTAAGVRVQSTLSGTPSYTPSTTPIQSSGGSVPDLASALNTVTSNNGQIFHSSTCLSTSPCASYPALQNSDPYVLLQQPRSLYKYLSTSSIDQNGNATQFLQITPTTSGLSDYQVGFVTEIDAINYLNQTDAGSLPYIYVCGSDPASLLSTLFTTALPTTSMQGCVQSGPVSSYQIQTQINADYTQVTKTLVNTYPSSTLGTPDPNTGIYPVLPNSTTSLASGHDIGGWSQANTPVINSLDAYGVNLQPLSNYTLGKISLSSSTLDSTIQASTAARFINQLWQYAASQPGYQGIPYPSTNPVTAPNSNPNANPQLNPSQYPLPSLRDFLSPLNPNGDPVYISDTGTADDPLVAPLDQTSPTPDNDASSPSIDLSSPSLQPPTLETPPTALAILQPLLNLIGLNSQLNLNVNQGVCPTGVINLPVVLQGMSFTQTYTINYHCTLFENIRAALSAVMLTSFAVVSFRVVMRA